MKIGPFLLQRGISYIFFENSDIFFYFTIFDSLIYFQRALNHYDKVIFSWDVTKNVFWKDLGPKCQKSGFGPHTPKCLMFFKFSDYTIFDSLIRFQRALNHYESNIFSWDMTKNVFWQDLGPKSQKSGFGPQTPKILRTFEFSDFNIFDSLIRFQWALNHYHSIIFSCDITKNVFRQDLGPKSQKSVFFAPDPKILKNFDFFISLYSTH